MDDELVPVFLSEREGRVSVLMLLDTGAQLALYEGDRYKTIGQVYQVTRIIAGYPQTSWSWHYDEEEWGKASGYEPTKARAVAAVLAQGGYRAVDDNAVTPPLF